MYKTEEEFLMNYDSNNFDKLSVTTDVLLVSVSDKKQDNYRKTDIKAMSSLLVKRDDFPYKGKWCLPGGFLGINEDLEECPKRILEKETNLKDIFLEQLYTFGKVNRDPRMRIVSTAYMALVDKIYLVDEKHRHSSVKNEYLHVKIVTGNNMQFKVLYCDICKKYMFPRNKFEMDYKEKINDNMFVMADGKTFITDTSFKSEELGNIIINKFCFIHAITLK